MAQWALGALSRMLPSSPCNRAECLCKRWAGCCHCREARCTEGSGELGQGLPLVLKLPEYRRIVVAPPTPSPGSPLPSAQGCMALALRNSILTVLQEPSAYWPSGSGQLTDY